MFMVLFEIDEIDSTENMNMCQRDNARVANLEYGRIRTDVDTRVVRGRGAFVSGTALGPIGVPHAAVVRVRPPASTTRHGHLGTLEHPHCQ